MTNSGHRRKNSYRSAYDPKRTFGLSVAIRALVAPTGIFQVSDQPFIVDHELLDDVETSSDFAGNILIVGNVT